MMNINSLFKHKYIKVTPWK